MIMGLVFSLVPELKGLMEGFVVMPFLYYYCRSIIHTQMGLYVERNG